MDPVVERYRQILELASGSVQPTADGALSTDTLQRRIDAAKGSRANVADELAAHIARTTNLTTSQAKQVVEAAGANGFDADARAVSTAATGAAVASTAYALNVSMKDPVMLDARFRAGFAGVFAVVLMLAVIFAFVLAEGNDVTASWPYVALAVIGAVSFLGILVLAMGYKSVEVETGPSASP